MLSAGRATAYAALSRGGGRGRAVPSPMPHTCRTATATIPRSGDAPRNTRQAIPGGVTAALHVLCNGGLPQADDFPVRDHRRSGGRRRAPVFNGEARRCRTPPAVVLAEAQTGVAPQGSKVRRSRRPTDACTQ